MRGNRTLIKIIKKTMNKKERLESLRRQQARENELYLRDGEDYRIQSIRDKMARTLNDAEIDTEQRKARLAALKEEIKTILDKRDEREHQFIEKELQRHKLEQKLEQEIAQEEAKINGEEQSTAQQNSLNLLFRARPLLTAGAEQLRKTIEENQKNLTEDEQFSTILTNNSKRDTIPDFKKSCRKKAELLEQTAKIDTIVIKQREIGMMYRESQEQQNIQLGKAPKTPPKESDDE